MALHKVPGHRQPGCGRTDSLAEDSGTLFSSGGHSVWEPGAFVARCVETEKADLELGRQGCPLRMWKEQPGCVAECGGRERRRPGGLCLPCRPLLLPALATLSPRDQPDSSTLASPTPPSSAQAAVAESRCSGVTGRRSVLVLGAPPSTGTQQAGAVNSCHCRLSLRVGSAAGPQRTWSPSRPPSGPCQAAPSFYWCKVSILTCATAPSVPPGRRWHSHSGCTL